MDTLLQLLLLWAIVLITTLGVVLWWRPTPEQVRELWTRVRESVDVARRRVVR